MNRNDPTPRWNPRQRAIQLLLFVTLFFVVWTLRATILYALDERIPSALGRTAFSSLLKLAFWVLPAVIFVIRLRHASPMTYLGLTPLPDGPGRRFCFIVTAAYLTIVAACGLWVAGKTFSLATLRSLSPPLLILQFVVSPWCEELLFRGLVMKELTALLSRRFPANLLTSLLFVGSHLPFWLTHDVVNRGMLANVAGVFLFSLLAGWLYSRSGSIWPPILAHATNNLLAACLMAA